MIAFALMSIIFGGVILAQFGSAYWAIAAQTSNEGLYKAKTRLEEMRAVVKKDFRMASSSLQTKIFDPSCDAGGLCYFIETKVSDLSPCSKYVEALVSWQVQGYPTTTTSLFTNLTDAGEAINLGGDCPLVPPGGSWNAAAQTASADLSGSNLSGVDVLGGMAYVASSQHPALGIMKQGNFISFGNAFEPMDPYNAIEVARDLTTGRTYAYAAVASTSIGLEVLDVTDPNNPVSVTKLALNVDKNGSFPQGWRLAYYERKIYIVTRETLGSEFHVVDVSNPSNPVEPLSYNLNIDTSAYGIVVRDFKQGSSVRRLAFLATTKDDKELMVLDVTHPEAIFELTGATTNLPGGFDGTSIFLAGNTLYLGRESNPSGPELYALDASNIFTAAGGLPVLSTAETGGTVQGIRVSDPYVFVGSGKNGGQLQIFKTSAGVLSTTPISVPTQGLSGGIDMEGNYLYTAGNSAPRLRLIQSQ